MADIVDIDTQREQWTGQVKCLSCGREWTAVAPKKTRHYACPTCGEMKGRRFMEVDPGEMGEFMRLLIRENRSLKQLVADLSLELKSAKEGSNDDA